MAGLSARALHHYDSIGLVSPAERNAAGYRLYGEEELLRLQQVLFYRELGLELGEIRRILDEPGYDRIGSLEAQARQLKAKAERLSRLALTVDRTIGRLKGETMLSDEQLYEGFAKDEVESIKREAAERWGATEAYAESKKRMARMSGQDWERVKATGEALDKEAALAMREGAEPGSPRVREIMARKLEHLRSFYEPSMEMFAGLGRMYEEDERFRRHYENIAPGLASYLRRAMAAYATARDRQERKRRE
jgi:DNA-binding transcriptional MerR regulator